MTHIPLAQEQALLAKIAQGNTLAFTELFDAYQGYVHRYALKLTRSEEHAVEVVQEIFIKVWTAREKLAGVENFGAYLNRMVKNHCLNVLRSIALQWRSVQELKDSALDFDDSTAQQIGYNETSRILREALEGLSPQQREVYMLCQLEGLKYSEAAERLGISPRTVQTHMGLALKHIRAHFREHLLLYPVLFALIFK